MEKKIYLTENNKAKVQEVLDAAQKQCTARTITVDDIYDDAEYLEKKLAIPKKHMEGITAVIDHNAQTFPGAYKYIPYSTVFKIERSHNKWALIDCYRDICRSRIYRVALTEKAKESIINNHSIID